MTARLTKRTWRTFAAILAGWWGFMFFASLPGMILPAVVVLFAAAASCFFLRRKEIGFAVWFPIAAILTEFLLAFLPPFCAELRLFSRNPAPLAGVAMIFGKVLLTLAVVMGVICVLSWPRRYSPLLCCLTVLNTAAVGWTAYARYESSVAEPITLRFLDSAGSPIPEVGVTYQVFGYGPGGRKPSSPARTGGPDFSGDDGKVMLRSKAGTYSVEITARKQGYEDLFVDLGMQYNKWQTTRRATISTLDMAVAFAEVPAAKPMEFTVYLARLEEIERPAEFHQLESRFVENQGKTRLDLLQCRFVDNEEADIRFEFFREMDDQGYWRSRLRVIAMNGAGVLQVPYYSNLVSPLSSFENVMKIAPSGGYSESVVISEPGSSPGPHIYVRARDGRTFARLGISGLSNPKNPGETARLSVSLLKTTDGSRALMRGQDRRSPQF